MRKLKFLLLVVVLLLSGCTTATQTSTPLVPDKSLQVTAKTAISFSKLAGVAVALAAINYIYDPLAPNWEIEESRVTDDTYHFSLKMKKYHTGGAGESFQILKRRATQLQSEQGFTGYQLLEYTEGIESQTLGAYRVAAGTVKLVQRLQADSFMLNERN